TECGVIAFFFQAEDGIRAFHVTGVQTCALPICSFKTTVVEVETNLFDENIDEIWTALTIEKIINFVNDHYPNPSQKKIVVSQARSEERRVGKERRYLGGRDHANQNNGVQLQGTT